MQYLLLIYEREADWNAMNEKEKGTIFQEYMAFTQGIMKNGNHRAGDALQPISTATTVRVRNGKTVTTDGPFAETREQLGGYYRLKRRTWTRRSLLLRAFPRLATARSRCGRSWCISNK